MGKCEFKCFEGYKRCETVIFTDANSNSFTMTLYQRAYNKGIAMVAWEGSSFTFGVSPSVGPFTASATKKTLECDFKSDMTMTNYRHPIQATVVIDGDSTSVTGYLSFNSSGYATFTLIGTVPDASTAATIYGGGAVYPQD